MSYSQSAELEEFQNLSDNYKPLITGPLVGERQPSTVITTEYANADPTYQRKTVALAQKYSHFRTSRRDGKCGWRAIAFGYFEALLKLGDHGKFLEEETRLRSLANMLTAAGFTTWQWEDFADVTFDLIRLTAQSVGSPTAEADLLRAFNDELEDRGIQSDAIIAHLKMLTAAYIKTHADHFAPFIGSDYPTVEKYVLAKIMPQAEEIEELGLSALSEIFLKPAGFALEVIHLDRSSGDEPNVHTYEAALPRLETIRLVYRPGHYDILYKAETGPAHAPITYLQYADHREEPITSLNNVPDVLTMIPGMSFVTAPQGWHTSPIDEAAFSPLPIQHEQPMPVPAMMPAYVQSMPIPQPPPMAYEYAMPVAQPTPISLNQFTPVNVHGPFRRSKMELEPGFGSAAAPHNTALQTSQFKNSPFNTAHFLNPDFHPEEWSPDNGYFAPTSRSSRHKHSG